jgi:SAM-dependent methyltransferase
MTVTVHDLEPLNRDYGLYEGVPIARHYIDQYIAGLAGKLRGTVLEFGGPTYAKQLGCSYEIIDIDAANPAANLQIDVCDDAVRALRPEHYDAILCTAVLQLVADPQRAVDNLHALLKPGGVLIVAEKTVSRIDPWCPQIDRWRFTTRGLERLLHRFSSVSLTAYGNVYVMCAYLMGIPAERVPADKLAYVDPDYPIVAVACATK